MPSDAYVERFWQKEATRPRTSLPVPDGFPRHLDSPLAWTGAEVEARRLHELMILIKSKFLLANHHDLSEISSSTFELPLQFPQHPRKLSDQIYKGVGFQLIRGLEPAKYTPKQSLIVYAGVSSHVCPQRGFVDVTAGGVVSRSALIHWWSCTLMHYPRKQHILSMCRPAAKGPTQRRLLLPRSLWYVVRGTRYGEQQVI